MACDLTTARARVGLFHPTASRLGRKLYSLNAHCFSSFLVLFFSRPCHRITLSLFYFLFLHPAYQLNRKTRTAPQNMCSNIPDKPIKPCQPAVSNELLLLSGDVHPNPGPPCGKSDLCAIHVNARSIENKIDLLHAETKDIDIVTVSETWLSNTIDDKIDKILFTKLPPSC